MFCLRRRVGSTRCQRRLTPLYITPRASVEAAFAGAKSASDRNITPLRVKGESAELPPRSGGGEPDQATVCVTGSQTAARFTCSEKSGATVIRDEGEQILIRAGYRCVFVDTST